jgi:hypothetical protein
MGVCKCGCGQKVPLGAGRASKRACYLASFRPALNRLGDLLDGAGQSTLELDAFLDHGYVLTHSLLEACHNPERSGFIPNAKEVADWERAAFRHCQLLKKRDPVWYGQWSGPSDKGPLGESERGLGHS